MWAVKNITEVIELEPIDLMERERFDAHWYKHSHDFSCDVYKNPNLRIHTSRREWEGRCKWMEPTNLHRYTCPCMDRTMSKHNSERVAGNKVDTGHCTPTKKHCRSAWMVLKHVIILRSFVHKGCILPNPLQQRGTHSTIEDLVIILDICRLLARAQVHYIVYKVSKGKLLRPPRNST